jgi:shikimate dehydrogenase
MHRAAYEALGLPFVYVPFAVESKDLPGAVAGMRALGIRGFGVSMPFKLEVVALCDVVDPLAQKIGAANTLVNDDGRVTAHNTDAEGAARALEEVVTTLEGATCLVLGAGGAARAVAHGLAARGASVTLANRTDARAIALAKELGEKATAIPWADRGATGADIVVNASSGGMDVGEETPRSPLDSAGIRPGSVVMDIVYKPIETELVRAARARGATAIHGGRMLLHQAARQVELYTGRAAPLAAMDEAIRRAIG